MPSTSAHLGSQIAPLRRALLRRTRAHANLPDLPDAQVEVLRVLVQGGPATPGALASQLQVARSTVSNLLRAMIAAGLVERGTGEDLRTARVTATPRAADLLARYDTASERVLDEALSELTAADRRAIERAAPALARLTAAIDRRDNPSAGL
ncbi:MarR family transcriptional regulator [Amycolatopsis sp. NPDC049688]|uniref:MarR family winged helix-turn-helix transcriptional regulator n=1 Tax=Amycolatopsis sp. NPDC049688 TaxID=3154733 RepID=UPI00343E0F8E